jgi:hypothetical protein
MKFLWLSALSCGSYPIYWIYRCWLNIQRRGRRKVMPRLSAVLYPITYGRGGWCALADRRAHPIRTLV